MIIPAIALSLVIAVSPGCPEWDSVVEEVAEYWGIPVEYAKAIMYIESYCDPYAVGSSNERGLFQIMPGTAQYIANLTGWNTEQILNDPVMNIRAGVFYFSIWYHRFGSLDLALSSYNGGPKYAIDHGKVNPHTRHYVDKAKKAIGWKFPSEICARGNEACLVEVY